MNPILLTALIATPIGAAFIAVITKMIIDKKNGKHVCSCGGNCSVCACGCSLNNKEK